MPRNKKVGTPERKTAVMILDFPEQELVGKLVAELVYDEPLQELAKLSTMGTLGTLQDEKWKPYLTGLSNIQKNEVYESLGKNDERKKKNDQQNARRQKLARDRKNKIRRKLHDEDIKEQETKLEQTDNYIKMYEKTHPERIPELRQKYATRLGRILSELACEFNPNHSRVLNTKKKWMRGFLVDLQYFKHARSFHFTVGNRVSPY